MFKHILNNIFTTAAGAFAGLPVFIEGVKTGDKNSMITGFGVFLIGLLSKDANK
jgi:hypothetical protein